MHEHRRYARACRIAVIGLVVSVAATMLTATAALGAPPTLSGPDAISTVVNQPITPATYVAGGAAPVTWSSDALPPDLTLSSTGVLSGTPTAVGTSTFTIRATNADGTASITVTLTVADAAVIAPPVVGDDEPSIVAVSPHRVFDSRGTERLAADGLVTVALTGAGGVPNDAKAVVVNLTADAAAGWGFVTVWPHGEARPDTSNLNVDHDGQTVANAAIVAVGPGGSVDVFTSTGLDLIVDVTGYVPADAAYTPIAPHRVLDARAGRALAAGSTVTLDVGAVPGAPAGVAAVAVNLTAVDAAGWGYLTAGPGGAARPVASNLNVTRAGQTAAASAIVPVSADGTVDVYTSSAAGVLVDVTGFFVGDDGLAPLLPTRVLSTRRGDHIGYSGKTPAAGATITLPVSAMPGVPADARTLVLSVTATDARGAGFVTVHPGGTDRPDASNLNVECGGQTVANAVVVPVGSDGTIRLYTSASTDLLVDVFGWAP